jgi:hypothetical protein
VGVVRLLTFDFQTFLPQADNGFPPSADLPEADNAFNGRMDHLKNWQIG